MQKVCDCLLRRGTQTLHQVVSSTELSRKNVKNCLLVLIHHNCVQAFAIRQPGTHTVMLQELFLILQLAIQFEDIRWEVPWCLMYCHLGGFGEEAKIITQYMALFDNIIHKLRFPKFIEIVSEELGKEVSFIGFACYNSCLPISGSYWVCVSSVKRFWNGCFSMVGFHSVKL